MKTWRIIASSFITFSLLASCSKAKIDTPYTKIEGNWYIVQTAIDDNGDGKLNNAELRSVTDDETMQFRKDSTGTLHVIINGTTLNYNFTWAFISNYTQLRRINFGEDTTIAQIETLTTTNLTLKNYTQPQASWYIMRKR